MRRTLVAAIALVALMPTSALASTVIVKYGDTLSGIAARHEVSIDTLMRLNGITDSNQLQVGKELILPEANSSSSSRTHIVQGGETLSSIALLYGTTQEAIVNLNNLRSSEYLYIGQPLKLPSISRSTDRKLKASHKVSSGETLSSIAMRYGINRSDLIRLNNLNSADYLYPGQIINLTERNSIKRSSMKATMSNKESTKRYHEVSHGETLSKIAKDYNISLETLIETNRITNPNRISKGTKLIISNTASNGSRSQNKAYSSSRESNRSPSSIRKVERRNADWRNYGPLKVDWSNWQIMAGSHVAPSINRDGKALYLAVNCPAQKLNATGINGVWKNWASPIDKFEKDLISDLCN